jgi:hypothetical protein
MIAVEVLGPKGPVNRFAGADMLTWARNQLSVAYDIVDNPGGGLGAAIQAIGQVKVGLREQGGDKYARVVAVLEEAEEFAVHRRFPETKDLVRRATNQITLMNDAARRRQ